MLQFKWSIISSLVPAALAELKPNGPTETGGFVGEKWAKERSRRLGKTAFTEGIGNGTVYEDYRDHPSWKYRERLHRGEEFIPEKHVVPEWKPGVKTQFNGPWVLVNESLLEPPEYDGPSKEECWSVPGITREHCCPPYDGVGNKECFPDDYFTYTNCCGNFVVEWDVYDVGEDPNEFVSEDGVEEEVVEEERVFFSGQYDIGVRG